MPDCNPVGTGEGSCWALAKKKAKSMADDLVAIIKNTANSLKDAALSGLRTMADKVKAAAQAVWDKAKEALMKAFGAVKDFLKDPLRVPVRIP